MTNRFEDKVDYGIAGIALNRLWEISCRFNDGLKIDANERRDLAQRMQALLAMTEPWPPEQTCSYERDESGDPDNRMSTRDI